MKKITLATLKKFIRENKDKLHINCKSSFNGMTDCVEQLHNGFNPIEQTPEHNEFAHSKQTLNIRGLWLVGSSRDYFTPYEDDQYTGIEVYNCCGTQILAVKKGA